MPSGLRQDAGTSTAYEAHSPRINNLHINDIRNILMGKSQSLLRELQVCLSVLHDNLIVLHFRIEYLGNGNNELQSW